MGNADLPAGLEGGQKFDFRPLRAKPNAAKLVAMRRDPELRSIVEACELVSADGQSVVWASRLLGTIFDGVAVAIELPQKVALEVTETEPTVDEQAAIYAIIQLGTHRVVTKFISEINFVASARQGDMIEMGLKATHFGRTSLTMRAEVRNMITRHVILTIEKIVFVNLGEDGKPAPHGYTEITYDRDRVPREHLRP